MTHQEGYLKAPNASKVYYQAWLPETAPKAILLIVHGLAEHSGRYMNLVNHFIPLGYAVYGFDHLGHGKSDGPRVYIDRFQDFLDTIKTYFDMIQSWQPGKPVYLIGHSMGGLISAIYLLEYQNDFAGAVLSGASVKIPAHISPVTITIGRVFSRILPKFGLIKLEADGISRDENVVKAYVNDPLVCTGKITARLAGELLGATQRIMAEAEKITLPILILHGGADKLVESDASRWFHDRIRSTDKTLKVYPGLFHEVFNEPEHGAVLRDVEGWIMRH
ncbi:MAG TPA: alpha/beta hydrolase [Bacteroidetes bacterium]|nr:alpha/beta hydrolase [Bacteroidota bacterium]